MSTHKNTLAWLLELLMELYHLVEYIIYHHLTH